MALKKTTLGNFVDTAHCAIVDAGTLATLAAGVDCASRATTETISATPGSFLFWVKGAVLPSSIDSGTASLTVTTLSTRSSGDVVLLAPEAAITGVFESGPNVWRLATVL